MAQDMGREFNISRATRRPTNTSGRGRWTSLTARERCSKGTVRSMSVSSKTIALTATAFTLSKETLGPLLQNVVLFYAKMFENPICHVISVTRFGEISPLWQIIQVVGNFRVTWFFIWQNFESTLANFYAIWQIFFVLNSQILNKKSGHTACDNLKALLVSISSTRNFKIL